MSDGGMNKGGRFPVWLLGLGPLAVVAALVAVFFQTGPTAVFSAAFPPVEELTIQRITLPEPGRMRVVVVNGGPEPVTIAQVLVDDAAWAFESDGAATVGRLERRVLDIPYPWVEGEPHEIALLTSTGLTFHGDVEVAVLTPRPNARYLGTFALLGTYVGVIPVFIGLLWLPFLGRIDRRWVDFFLSLTVGLLAFLGVDALAEGLEAAERVPGAFQGVGLVVIGLVGTVLGLAALSSRQRTADSGDLRPLYVAGLVALGIGLHNFGEGLVIGTSYAVGEIALGTFLVVGFLLHNTTEGLAIVAPVADARPRLRDLAALGAIAGVPTILGAWLGGFAYDPALNALFFGVGAGAIAQVVYQIAVMFRRADRGLTTPLNAAGLMLGMVVMWATGLLI